MNCGTHEAVKHPTYGWLPCDSCQKKRVEVSESVEFTSESIKEQRKEHRDDILQPHREGRLSKEWLDKYGEKAAQKRGFSRSEIVHATDVWGDTYYKREN